MDLESALAQLWPLVSDGLRWFFSLFVGEYMVLVFFLTLVLVHKSPFSPALRSRNRRRAVAWGIASVVGLIFGLSEYFIVSRFYTGSQLELILGYQVRLVISFLGNILVYNTAKRAYDWLVEWGKRQFSRKK